MNRQKLNIQFLFKFLFIFIMLTCSLILAGCLAGCTGSKDSDKLKPADDYRNAETDVLRKSAAGQSVKDSICAGEANEQKSKQEDVLSEIDEMLVQEVPPYNALFLLDKSISIMDTKKAESAADAVEKLLKIYEIKYGDMFFSDDVEDYQKQLKDFAQGFAGINNEEITKEQAANIWEEGLSSLLDEMYDSGFKLVNLKGLWTPVIDYSRILPYVKYLGDDYAAGIAFKAMESDKIYRIDETVKVSWNEIASRIISAEDFLLKYPQSSKYAEMAGKYYDYLSVYFTGADNTPVIDDDSGKFRDEVLESYNNIVNNRNNEKFFIYKVITNYLEVISSNNNIMNVSVLDFIKQSYKDAEKNFGIKNPYLLQAQLKLLLIYN
ncbi:MAG: hypothetical protein BWY60_00531 [Actinobacteria bacterium ADurb.Bin346]|nr:MAG: hypothetical protein BWY60_00531 [Actinobacteria bacterium ADurb.Bin346]